MDIEALRTTLEQATLASLGVGFASGFFFSFNPVAIAAIPVSFAYVTKAQDARRALLYTAMFVVGMVVAHLLLGAIAGLGGAWVQRLFGRAWGLVLGPVLIVLGLAWPGWVRVPVPQIAVRARPAASSWGAAAFGAVFSIAVCPFCTPALLVLLGVAAAVGSPLFGAALLLAFAVGRSVPVVAGASAVGWLEGSKALHGSRRAFEVAGGIVLILTGLYMLNAYLMLIPGLAV